MVQSLIAELKCNTSKSKLNRHVNPYY